MDSSPKSETPVLKPYLQPTWFIDSDAPEVIAFTETALGNAANDRERAVRLYYAVRDGIRYDPYAVASNREAYRASVITELAASVSEAAGEDALFNQDR